MGQATADLPDPTKDLSTAHAGGADDLLAQLAGDEIDRLLAESDVEPVAVEKAATIAADAPVVAATATPTPSLTPTMAPAPIPVKSVPAADPEAQLAIPSISQIATVLDEPEASTTASHHDVEMHHTAPPVPIWLKPLQWMNAPLDALPDSLRDLVGKIAIATTANALAVLAYVALFHRHH